MPGENVEVVRAFFEAATDAEHEVRPEQLRPVRDRLVAASNAEREALAAGPRSPIASRRC
jgi:hypothetical protein